ncbi:hypothetical protein KCP73_20430 [Salmonella enterica subsp. enterica]|nr:hypothetical protein KCP73_20430 [Salmonella enterica subsp. enterica]
MPGRVSTEVDARLSFDKKEEYRESARAIWWIYQQQDVDKSRAFRSSSPRHQVFALAEQLEKRGDEYNLTLLFSFARTRALRAEAERLFNLSVRGPFTTGIRRVVRWAVCVVEEDRREIGTQYLRFTLNNIAMKTIVMGASFPPY